MFAASEIHFTCSSRCAQREHLEQQEEFNLKSLDSNELSEINGGVFKEIGWFLGSLVGYFVNDVSAAKNGTYTQSSGSAAMHKALH